MAVAMTAAVNINIGEAPMPALLLESPARLTVALVMFVQNIVLYCTTVALKSTNGINLACTCSQFLLLGRCGKVEG